MQVESLSVHDADWQPYCVSLDEKLCAREMNCSLDELHSILAHWCRRGGQGREQGGVLAALAKECGRVRILIYPPKKTTCLGLLAKLVFEIKSNVHGGRRG